MTTRLIAVTIAAVLVAAAYQTYQYRRALVQRFFVRGPGGAPAPVLALPADPAVAARGLPQAERVRVVLIDGIDRDTARRLPRWSALCDEGIELTVDSGFPTVSLPIQRVLWTGLTQQQTGIEFLYALLPAPAIGVPGQVPGSVAVAESHQKIVHSLGFERVLPAVDRAPIDWGLETSWRPWLDFDAPRGFEREALAAVVGDARLAFVHVLRTDSIGHKRGRVSREFHDAAGWADAFLGTLIDAERAAHGPGTRWLVIADHGHRAAGGHGGAEPWIRTVRACVAGALPADGRPRPGAYVHLVDVSRALADSLGVRLDPGSAGRPLYAALAAPVARDATLPRPGLGRWIIAIAILLGAAAVTGWAARGRRGLLPWWWPVGYLSLVVLELPPSMSTHMIYQPLGRIVYQGALPGLCLLAIMAALALRRESPLRVTLAALAIPAALVLAALVLCGAIGGVDPPLMPRWTAHASVFLIMLFSAAVVVALALLASAVPSWSDRTTRDRTDRSAA